MTYDPLSYGEIKLRDRAATSGDSPDDILFEDAGPGYASEESPQSDWSEPGDGYTAFGSTGAPNVTQFGADVLGETGGFGEPAAPPAHSPFGGAPAPRPAVARASSAAPPSLLPPEPQSQSNRPATPRPLPPRTPTASLPRRSATARRPVDRPGRLMGTLAPAIAVAVGGCASAWFYMMEQNMVMAGIIGVTTLVGAATLRVMFK